MPFEDTNQEYLTEDTLSWLNEALRRTADYLRNQRPGRSFDMNLGCRLVDRSNEESAFRCGAAACIGGHAYLIAHGFTEFRRPVPMELADSASDFVRRFDPVWGEEREHPVAGLFFPKTLHGAWEDIRPGEAAKAIDAFLSGSEDPWSASFPTHEIPDRARTTNRD